LVLCLDRAGSLTVQEHQILPRSQEHHIARNVAERIKAGNRRLEVFNCLIKLTELVTKAYEHLDAVRRRSRSSMDVGDSPLQTLGETGSSSHIEAASTAVQPGPVFDDSYITGGGYITYETFSSIFT